MDEIPSFNNTLAHATVVHLGPGVDHVTSFGHDVGIVLGALTIASASGPIWRTMHEFNAWAAVT